MSGNRNETEDSATGRGTQKHADGSTPDERRERTAAGAGAASAGVIGTAIGIAVGGPVGGIVGAATGAAVGALGGKKVAEIVNHDEYWRENYTSRPYVRKDLSYDDYQPAYRHGWESRTRYDAQDWNTVEGNLGRDWDQVRGTSRLGWEEARPAARDAWERVDNRDDTRS